jgi:prepilin-type processing-associated H-X9-DG protein
MTGPKRVIWRSRAFTLVELLVALGIITALIAILLPALSRARQNAQNLQCASNLRTLGQLLMLHAADHRGYLPLAGAVEPGPSGSYADSPDALGDPQRLLYDYLDNGFSQYCVTALPAALAPYIDNQPAPSDSWQSVDACIQASGPLQGAFTCPSDDLTVAHTYQAPLWISNTASATFLVGWSSYAVNEEVFGWGDAGATVVNNLYYPCLVVNHHRARGQISSIPNPSQTMLMCDSFKQNVFWVAGANLSLGDVYLGKLPQTIGDTAFDLARHRGQMNILFVDGHVEDAPILSTGATAPSGGLGTTGNSPSGALFAVSMDRDFR